MPIINVHLRWDSPGELAEQTHRDVAKVIERVRRRSPLGTLVIVGDMNRVTEAMTLQGHAGASIESLADTIDERATVIIPSAKTNVAWGGEAGPRMTLSDYAIVTGNSTLPPPLEGVETGAMLTF